MFNFTTFAILIIFMLILVAFVAWLVLCPAKRPKRPPHWLVEDAADDDED